MKKIALFFRGQGSYYIGSGKVLGDRSEAAKQTFGETDTRNMFPRFAKPS